MEPEVFLEQKDVVPLTKALIQVLSENYYTTSDRHSLLDNAGIHSAFISNLRLDSSASILAQALVAEFKRYRVDNRRPNYHPMVNLLAYLYEFAEMLRLSDEDSTLFSRLVSEGQENFKSLKNPSAVELTQSHTKVRSLQPHSTTKRDRVFISYSREDKVWLDRLQTMLKPLVRDERISVWDDTQIPVGSLWKDEINKALASAKVAVLMVSADFVASDFIAEHELPPLLAAAKQGQLTLIWIYLSACIVPEEIAAYQTEYNPSVPLNNLKSAQQDEVLLKICKQIEQAANKPTF